jgi:hypothetical protein
MQGKMQLWFDGPFFMIGANHNFKSKKEKFTRLGGLDPPGLSIGQQLTRIL